MEARMYATLSNLMYVNQARDTLVALDVSIYKDLKTESRQKMHKKYHKIAYPESVKPKNIVRFEDIKRVTNGR